MQFWIDYPIGDNPVSFSRWWRWKLSGLFGRWHRSLERDALYPLCDGCGTLRRRGDHTKCDDIPF